MTSCRHLDIGKEALTLNTCSALIDLHCDTLTEWKYTNTGNPDTLDDPKRVLSLSGMPKGVHWAQFFAVFIPDEERGQRAIDYFDANRANFERQMELFSDRVAPCRNAQDMENAWAAGKTAAFLTVENGSVFAGSIERVQRLAEQGVRAVTLVWNGENEIGSGHNTDRGLSDFGKRVVPEMEKHNVIVDVSHLNDRGFADLLEIAEKPFMATHSNARAICSHKRNLTDDMVREMVRRDCLIGLNYYVNFLADDGHVGSLEVIYRHAMHFFELGARKNLALGSDFDGAVLPECLSGPDKALEFYEYLLARGISQEDADGIFYQNARRFFYQNLR